MRAFQHTVLFSLLTGAFMLLSAKTVNSFLVVKVDSTINPFTALYVERAVRQAEEEGEGVILLINTPGGLLDSSLKISQALLNATVPVITYVYPRGARAASAGVFVLASGDFWAMAPQTHLGAASPVSLGESGSKVLEKKIFNDTTAYLRSLLERRGRARDEFLTMVTEAKSFTAKEAKEMGLVDEIAIDVNDLLRKLAGRKVEKYDNLFVISATPSLRTAHMNLKEKFYDVLSNPNISYLLLTIGTYGITFEIFHPGALFPGIVGGICLILGLIGLSTLPANYGALALLILGVVMLFFEFKTRGWGILGIAGLTSFVLGSLLLFDTKTGVQISRPLIATLAFLIVLLTAIIVYAVVKTYTRKVVSGKEGMVGEKGKVVTVKNEKECKIFIQGEYWDVYYRGEVKEGDRVKVVGFQEDVPVVEKLKDWGGEEK